jgi:cytoskeletal protein RodZ
MIRRALKIFSLLVALILLFAVAATAQELATKSSVPVAETGKPAVSKTDKKSQLAEATRASTTDAAKDAVQAEAKKENTSDDAVASGVLEFQPKTASDANKSSATISKDSGKSALKNVHGSVSGSVDAKHPANHQTAAAVGASTKSRNTSVYVETDSSRGPSPQPR